MKKIITYGNKLTINTGNFENESPLISETIEIDNDNVNINEIYKEMKERVDTQLASYKQIYTKGEKENKFIELDNIKYARVTDVIGQMYDLSNIPNIQKYADEGTRVHSIIEEQIQNKSFNNIEGYKVLDCIKNLTELGVDMENGNTEQRFYKKVDSKVGYTGCIDYLDNQGNIVDWKTGTCQDTHKIQMIAYLQSSHTLKKAFICELKTGNITIIDKQKDEPYLLPIFKALFKVYINRYK